MTTTDYVWSLFFVFGPTIIGDAQRILSKKRFLLTYFYFGSAKHTFLFEESFFQSFCLLVFDDHYPLLWSLHLLLLPALTKAKQYISSSFYNCFWSNNYQGCTENFVVS